MPGATSSDSATAGSSRIRYSASASRSTLRSSFTSSYNLVPIQASLHFNSDGKPSHSTLFGVRKFACAVNAVACHRIYQHTPGMKPVTSHASRSNPAPRRAGCALQERRVRRMDSGPLFSRGQAPPKGLYRSITRSTPFQAGRANPAKESLIKTSFSALCQARLQWMVHC